jgi:DoxX-like protein
MTIATIAAVSDRIDFAAAPRTTSRKAVLCGRALSGLAIAFLLMDSVVKFLKPAPVIASSAQLGFPERLIGVLGVVLLACTALYAWRRTAVLGAVLLTGYLGGAVCTHLRVGDPLFSHVLFPTYLGAMLWAGLWLRDPRLRSLLPLRAR